MSDVVKEMLGKFIDLSQEEKQIAAEMDAAYKEYTDYCADSENDLNRKIDEIREKMSKLDHFIEYAREHANASELESAAEPFDTSEGTLESIRQTIKLDSHNDPNAETLYTKATGKKLYYEQEIERTRQLIEGSKVQAKRQYDSDTAKLNKKKDEHFEKVREYVQSNDFSEYLKLLVYDKSAFNSPGTVNLNSDEYISIGQRRVKLSLPMEIEQDVALSSNGEYNAAAHTIGAPMQVSVKKGSTLFLEHDERNGQYLLGGIQRLLLNFIKYFGEDLTSVLFCEPERFSADSLGNIAALGKGINPFITVPKSMGEVEERVSRLAAKAASAPTPDKVSRILVLQEFPEMYSDDTAQKVLELCRNAESTGTLIIITHGIPAEVTPLEAEVRKLSEVIRSRNGGFRIESLHESLFWYSAPSDISEEVRRVYVEKRRQDALNAAQEQPVPPAPAPVPVEEPKPVEQPAQPIYTAPVEEPMPVDEAMFTAPAEEPEPMGQPVYTAPTEEAESDTSAPNYGDDNLNSLSMSEDGKPIPAHILFSIPRPKPEEKEVTMTVMSETSVQLPPPEEEEEPKPIFDDRPDFRPEQKIDPELTYRITDHPQTLASAIASSPVRPSAPEPVAERRNPIKGVLDAGKGVIDAGRRKIGEFVDNRKADSAAKASARVSGVN